MTDFDPFSDEGKAWLEDNEVENQYNTLENLGNNMIRRHSTYKNIFVAQEKKETNSKKKEDLGRKDN